MEEEYLEFAKEIAEEAGKIMLKYFKADNGSTYKGDKTIVTLADKEINAYLIKRVKQEFPDHCVDGEEEAFGKTEGRKEAYAPGRKCRDSAEGVYERLKVG